MLFLAVVALVMPAVFDLTLYGTLEARPPAIDRLSLGTAIVLITAYIGSLVYAFTAERDLFRPARVPAPQALRDYHGGRHRAAGHRNGGDNHPGRTAGRRAGAGPQTVRLHRVVCRRRGRRHHRQRRRALLRDCGRASRQMTLALEISVGSSAQIALFVAPAIILYSFAIGRPMSLIFNPFEISSIALSVLATSMVVGDGESNWVEGLQLISVYAIIALAFYFIP